MMSKPRMVFEQKTAGKQFAGGGTIPAGSHCLSVAVLVMSGWGAGTG